MKKIWLTILILALLVGAGFWFRNDLLKFYHSSAKNVAQFQKTGLQNTIDQVKQQILAPNPLNIGGQDSGATFTKTKIIAQTNAQRFDNGKLPALIENAQLDKAALAKANDMFKKQYFEHVSPSGVDPGQLVKSFGYQYIMSGENLISGNFKSEQELVEAWMNSSGHRANILNNRFTDIGVAVVRGMYKGETVWISVQEFGLPLSACQSPSVALKTEIENNKNILDQLSAQIDAKKDEIDNTNQRDPKYNQLVDEYNALINQYNQLNQETKNIIANYNAQVNNFNACVNGQ